MTIQAELMRGTADLLWSSWVSEGDEAFLWVSRDCGFLAMFNIRTRWSSRSKGQLGEKLPLSKEELDEMWAEWRATGLLRVPPVCAGVIKEKIEQWKKGQ